MPLSPTLLDLPTRDALLARVRALRPDAPRQWGTMTVSQMIWHVSEAMRAALGDIEVDDRSNWLFRNVARPLAFHLPFPWPRNSPTMPQFNAVRAAPREDRAHAAQVAEMATLIERFASTSLEGRPHAAFGPLTQAEWQHWGWRHAHHHLRQFAS